MADNTTLEGTLTSSGDVIHTDDLTAGTYKMATSKIIFGESGANDAYWAAGAGAVGTDVGRVTLASDDPAVTALQLIDNAVSGAGFNITQFGGVAVTLNTGVRDTGTQRVTIATDDSLAVTNAGTFVVQVDGAALTALQLIDDAIFADNAAFTLSTSKTIVAGGVFQSGTPGTLADNDVGAVLLNSTAGQMVELMASTASIGKLAANTGVDIGDVDILSIAAGDNNIGNVDIVSGVITTVSTVSAVTSLDKMVHVDDAAFTLGTHSGVMMMGFAGTQSVNANDAGAIAMETDGSVHIHDGGNSITVDGTVTANPASGTIDTVTTVTTCNLAAETTKVIGTVNVAAAQTIALSAGTAEIGKLAAGVAEVGNVKNSGTFAVQSTLQAGTAEFGKLAAGAATVGGVFAVADATATGTATFYDEDLDETKIEVTDNPNVRIYSINAFNTTAAPLFLQLWDLDSTSVTVGTTKPTNQYVIPGNADSDGAGFVINFAVPKSYTTGFTVACTTDSEGLSAPGAGACIVNIEYISAA